MTNATWENLAVQAKFSPHQLAALCNVSLRTLQRRFDQEYGMPIGHWMRNFRVSQAYGRIVAGETVKSVAYDLGFKQLSHFSRVFKGIYGVAPTFISRHHPAPENFPVAPILPLAQRQQPAAHAVAA